MRLRHSRLASSCQVLEHANRKSPPSFKAYRMAETLDGCDTVPHVAMLVVANRLAELNHGLSSGRDRPQLFVPPHTPTHEHAGGGWRKLEQELRAFVGLLNTAGGTMVDAFRYKRTMVVSGGRLQTSFHTAWHGTIQDLLCLMYDVVVGRTGVAVSAGTPGIFQRSTREAWLHITARTAYIRSQSGQGSPMWPHIPFNMVVAMCHMVTGRYEHLVRQLKELPVSTRNPVEGTLRSKKSSTRIAWNGALLRAVTAVATDTWFDNWVKPAFVGLVCSNGPPSTLACVAGVSASRRHVASDTAATEVVVQTPDGPGAWPDLSRFASQPLEEFSLLDQLSPASGGAPTVDEPPAASPVPDADLPFGISQHPAAQSGMSKATLQRFHDDVAVYRESLACSSDPIQAVPIVPVAAVRLLVPLLDKEGGSHTQQDVAYMAATMASLQEADAKLAALIDSVTNLVTTEARATQATIAAAIASANHPTQPDYPRRDDDGDDDGATTVPPAMAAVRRTLVRLARHAGLLPQLGLVALAQVLMSSAGGADLVTANPFAGLDRMRGQACNDTSATDAVMDLTALALLQACRLQHCQRVKPAACRVRRVVQHLTALVQQVLHNTTHPVSVTIQQRLRDGAIELENETASLVSVITARRHYVTPNTAPHAHGQWVFDPRFLVFEFLTGFLLRQRQCVHAHPVRYQRSVHCGTHTRVVQGGAREPVCVCRTPPGQLRAPNAHGEWEDDRHCTIAGTIPAVLLLPKFRARFTLFYVTGIDAC